MIRLNYELKVNDDYNLKGYIWKADVKKAIIVICHGMAEHIERYEDFANFLVSKGYVVLGYNQRGHGLTAGSLEKVGYMDDDDNLVALVEDLKKNIDNIKKDYPGLKVILFGHSMGSFISQRYIELYSDTIDGCILSGSALNKGLLISVGNKLAKIITKKKGRTYRSKLMNDLSFGSYNKAFKPNRTEFDWLSTDNSQVDKYVNDEYCGNLFTVSFFMDFTNLFLVTSKEYNKVRKNLPIYIFSGNNDPVGAMGKNVKKLYKEYKKENIQDVNIKLYPNGRHEMLNEVNKEEVYNDVFNWIEEKI